MSSIDTDLPTEPPKTIFKVEMIVDGHAFHRISAYNIVDLEKAVKVMKKLSGEDTF